MKFLLVAMVGNQERESCWDGHNVTDLKILLMIHFSNHMGVHLVIQL